MWIEDLSPWGDDDDDAAGSTVRAVGWLERGRPYATGPLDPAVYAKLVELLADPWQPFVHAGVHGCTLCRFAPEKHGTANLYVPGGGGVLYVCPELVAHYANAHGYRPPEEFCAAVLACPPMRSMA